MIERVNAFISSISAKGDAYAIRSDNGEDIFIGGRIVERLDLEELDEIDCLVQLNQKNDGSGTQWFARCVHLVEDDE